MKKVGIVPSCDLFLNNNVYEDKYYFPNTYVVRAFEAGMLPVGVLPVNGHIRTSVLSECDCFILCGGKGIYPYHIDVVEHAVKTGKKLLGICLGHQSVHTYFKVAEEAQKRGFTGPASELYTVMKKEGFEFLKAVPGHRAPMLERGNEDASKHRVLLTEDSHLARIFGQTEVMGASLHTYIANEPASSVKITGRSADDGVVEAIEYGENIIGTQFHPDADGKLPQIFDWLAE